MRNYKLPEWRNNLELLQVNYKEFLLRNNAYDEFCNEAEIDAADFGEFWDNIGNAQYYPMKWVSCAFIWKYSYRGQAYWEVLQEMWYEQLKQDNEL